MFFAKPYWDALIIIFIVLLFFGPKRLPGLGKSLGQGMREFKDSISGKSSESDKEPQQLEAASPRPRAASPRPRPASPPPRSQGPPRAHLSLAPKRSAAWPGS
jgi:sec-independent protein translocase protein TatA